jgi:hypothetical protein
MNRIYLSLLGVWLGLTKASAQQPVQAPAPPLPVEQGPPPAPNPAPSPPIPIELLAGNNRFGFQFVMNKAFTPGSRFSYLNVNVFTSDYSSSRDNLDLVIISNVAYNLYKGFGLTAGLSVNPIGGLSPTTGIQYAFANKRTLFVVTPSVEFAATRNVQGLVIGEYRPPLSQKIDLFTRVQALYNHNTDGDFHLRSSVQFRLGVGIGHYQFGPAANLDYSGPEKNLKENYGAFIRYNFY